MRRVDKKFTQSLFDLMYTKEGYVFNAQYSPILADTNIKHSHNETNKATLETEISAKHVFSGINSS